MGREGGILLFVGKMFLYVVVVSLAPAFGSKFLSLLVFVGDQSLLFFLLFELGKATYDRSVGLYQPLSGGFFLTHIGFGHGSAEATEVPVQLSLSVHQCADVSAVVHTQLVVRAVQTDLLVQVAAQSNPLRTTPTATAPATATITLF